MGNLLGSVLVVCVVMPVARLNSLTLTCTLLYQVRQEISPIVMTVISCLVPILQHAEVVVSSNFLLFVVSLCFCLGYVLSILNISPYEAGAEQVTHRK